MASKDLRVNSTRKQTEELIETLMKQLNDVPELYKEDLILKLDEYKLALYNEEMAENTKDKYIRNASWFIDNYTNNDDPLDKKTVIEFKEDLINKYDKVATINSYITTVNRFLFFCDLGTFKVNKIKMQRDNVLDDRIYHHEFKSMYTKAKALGMLEMHYLIKVMGMTGIRVAEREAFTVDSIQGLYVEARNKQKTRKVPVRQDLMRDLRKYAKSQGIEEGCIFKLTYKQIYNNLKLIAGHCKIKKSKIHPHAFRHYFGFRYVELGGNIAQLSDILGHNSTDVTRVYTNGTIEDYRKQTEGM